MYTLYIYILCVFTNAHKDFKILIIKCVCVCVEFEPLFSIKHLWIMDYSAQPQAL